MSSGKDLYAVYGGVTDFKNFQGNPMPEWEVLPDKIKLAWEMVAAAKDSDELPECREREWLTFSFRKDR